MFAAGRGRVSQRRAFSDGGAVVSGSFKQRGQVAACAVGEGHVLNRSPGHVDADDAGSAVGAPSHSGAAVARRGGPGGQRQRSSCSGTGATARSPGAGGSHHRAHLAPPGNVTRIWSRLSVACPRRNSGNSTRRASFARPSCGLNPRTGSAARSPVNGWRVPGVDGSGCATVGVAQRRSAGGSRVVAFSGARLGHGSFDRPVQHANGAVAPDRLCDHGAKARGSFATLCGSELKTNQSRCFQ